MVNKTSTLLIHFANRFDSGRVLCQASNGVGEVVRRSFSRLIVHRKFKFTLLFYKFLNEMQYI